MNKLLKIASLIGLAFLLSCSTKVNEEKIEYADNWESLKQHKTPEWFTNAKFGIYFHWGIYSVPAYKTEWYPHYMYFENYEKWGGDVRPHHIEKYGADFQYHDFIPMFTAEHFDAVEWAKLFKDAGAKYAGPVAEHHDNFSMWDSEVNQWNAAKMGPKCDIVGELEKAIKGEGLKFVATMHNAGNWGWYNNWSGLVDTSTAELRDFYGETTTAETFRGMSKNYEKFGPSEKFIETWKAKIFEVIDRYDPDMLWFDSKLKRIPEKERIDMVKYYYSKNAGKGHEVVLTNKSENLPVGVAVLDIEGGRLNHLADYPWLTDATFSYGGWCYTDGQKSKGANMNLDALIDIVSKNGCLLLNIGPRADGTIPQEIRDGLLEIGKWLKQYGEAIYKSKPFVAYGEGPTTLRRNRFGGYEDKAGGYGSYDFRYTTNGAYLYIMQLDTPEPESEYILKTFALDSIAGEVVIKEIEILGSDEEVKWECKTDGLHIIAPKNMPNDLALVYKAKIKK